LLSITYVASFSQYISKGEAKYYYFEDYPNEHFAIDTGLKNFEEYNFEKAEDWEYFNLGIIGSAFIKVLQSDDYLQSAKDFVDKIKKRH